MKIIIYGSKENSLNLINKVNRCLDELGLVEFIKVDTSIEEKLKTELNISKEPALIVEEEAIDFKDIIFEGIDPEEEELKSMFISIIGGSDSGCAPSDCGTCAGC